MTQVKVCGIKDEAVLEELDAVQRDVGTELDIDLLGFVFAPSTRQVTAEKAQALIEKARITFRKLPLFTGVFRNHDSVDLHRILGQVALDVVQFHGAETPELCAEVRATYGKRVMKVFSLDASAATAESVIADVVIQAATPYLGAIDMVLIDTHDPTYGGGSGKTFRWDVISDIRDWCANHGLPLFVAGGLQPGNVQQLLETYHPAGVDVSSGVETDGEKDAVKIISFLERVRAHDYSA